MAHRILQTIFHKPTVIHTPGRPRRLTSHAKSVQVNPPFQKLIEPTALELAAFLSLVGADFGNDRPYTFSNLEMMDPKAVSHRLTSTTDSRETPQLAKLRDRLRQMTWAYSDAVVMSSNDLSGLVKPCIPTHADIAKLRSQLFRRIDKHPIQVILAQDGEFDQTLFSEGRRWKTILCAPEDKFDQVLSSVRNQNHTVIKVAKHPLTGTGGLPYPIPSNLLILVFPSDNFIASVLQQLRNLNIFHMSAHGQTITNLLLSLEAIDEVTHVTPMGIFDAKELLKPANSPKAPWIEFKAARSFHELEPRVAMLRGFLHYAPSNQENK